MRVAVIGGGASGLACAVSLSGGGVDVDIYEKNDRPGRKILATGNGRCNLTNTSASSGGYRNMSFAGYALSKFSPESNIKFFNSIGLYTRTDPFGRVYPLSNQASGVLDALLGAIKRSDNINMIQNVSVETVVKENSRFVINGEHYADFVVIACGGKAAPSQGSDGSGYTLLKKLGHRITPVYPSLVQLVTGHSKYPKQLKGVRCEVNMTLFDRRKVIAERHGELLFTEYGLSGIVSMEISAFADFSGGKKPNVLVDFVPSFEQSELLKEMKKVALINPGISCEGLLAGFLPKAIGRVLLKEAGIEKEQNASRLSHKELSVIVNLVKHFSFTLTGTKDFTFAQVTKGGADTDFFDSRTMESKKVKNLYCAGEILDVDGDCGGYNLNWAWSSGRLAAESILEKAKSDIAPEAADA